LLEFEMPLHDWTDRYGWEGLHTYWMTEIGRFLRGTLPPGYRAVIGSSPFVALGVSPVKPDVAVTNGTGHPPPTRTGAAPEPDVEIAVATLEEDMTVQVEKDGRLVAAVELISPRNKDRPSSRDVYVGRYLSYLRGGVHVLIVDVHRRPPGFSFPQAIAAAFGPELPAPPTPSSVSYQVGAAAAMGGRMLAAWQKPMAFGQPLPEVPLPISLDDIVLVDLEGTYTRAAADSYVE
jgi:hypothetical protein